MATQDEFVRITVRLPPSLHRALEELAREHNVSINSEIVRMLKEKVSSEINTDIAQAMLSEMQIPFFARYLAERATERSANSAGIADKEKFSKIADQLEAIAKRVEHQVLEYSLDFGDSL